MTLKLSSARRNRIAALLCSAFVSTMVAPVEARALERRDTQTYEPAQGGAGAHRLHPATSEVVFQTTARENQVSLEISDVAGGPVMAAIFVRGEEATHICGSTAAPIFVEPSSEIWVRTMAGHCFDGSTSTPTRGEVTATFDRAPVVAQRQEVESYAVETREEYGVRGEGVLAATLSFEPGPQSKATFEVDDVAGGAVFGEVRQGAVTIAEFCTETDKPVKVTPHVSIELALWAGTCPGGTSSAAVRGSVTARYT